MATCASSEHARLYLGCHMHALVRLGQVVKQRCNAQVLALGRNTAGLDRLAKLDSRVVPVVLKPEEAPLDALKAALGMDEVGSEAFSLASS